jgi:hypothetical protein
MVGAASTGRARTGLAAAAGDRDPESRAKEIRTAKCKERTSKAARIAFVRGVDSWPADFAVELQMGLVWPGTTEFAAWRRCGLM